MCRSWQVEAQTCGRLNDGLPSSVAFRRSGIVRCQKGMVLAKSSSWGVPDSQQREFLAPMIGQLNRHLKKTSRIDTKASCGCWLRCRYLSPVLSSVGFLRHSSKVSTWYCSRSSIIVATASKMDHLADTVASDNACTARDSIATRRSTGAVLRKSVFEP